MAHGAADERTGSGPQVRVLSTDVAPAHKRFVYWREGLRQLFGVTAEDPAADGFSARAVVRSSGPFCFMLSDSTGFRVARSGSVSTDTNADCYSIYLQLSGRASSTRGNDTITFEAGDIAFSADRRPQLDRWIAGRCAAAMLPRAMIERRAPWLLDRQHVKLGSNARFARNLRLHMRDLTTVNASFSESEIGLLADSLCNLIALAAADGVPARRLPGELQLETLLAFCRQNLHDSELTPQHAADHVGISLSTLHARFRQTGLTFGRWLLEGRLEGCSAALRDPHQRALNISEVAYRWGFNDLSYFNKAFRAQFDMTPGEWRQRGPVS
jgi:AraC-like DNA-binding protein